MNTSLMRDRDPSGTRLVWAAIGVLGLIVLGYAGWLGITVTTLQEEIAGITAKLDILMHERKLQ